MKSNLLSTVLLVMLFGQGAVFLHNAHAHGKPAAATTNAQNQANGDGHSHAHDQSDAIGIAGKPDRVTRTVDIEMSDTMRFKPASIAVKQGETVRFIVKNAGQLKHEFVLGTTKALNDHYQLMKKFPEMEHADPNMVTVAPGQTGEVVWQFSRSGRVDFGCLQPGHYDAGMKGVVTVARAKGATKSGGQSDDHADYKH